MQPNIQFGVDYYPEHWPQSRWETDFAMMQDMGIDVVRLGEFSWFKLEPADGQFDFGWLDDVLALAAKHDIHAVLGTPTAAPPAWLIAQHPDIQPVDREGRTRYFGGRHHDCQSNPIYRDYIARFVRTYAQHFGKNPTVIGWQVDNELGNSHRGLCYCKYCQRHFQKWLREKYQTIENLNDNWGTAFWSQGYQDFSQIQAPKITVTGENPSEMLDWKECHSDLINEFHAYQAKIIRQYSPDRFITHNMMGFSPVVSYYDLGRQLDFASHDQYPSGHFLADQNSFRGDRCAAELDFIRGVKQQSFWIMEQQTTITGWEVMGRLPKPGQIPLWSMQSVAHGADAIVYFRWRSSALGTEQYWHGILPHSGIPGRAYREIRHFMRQTKPLLKEINGTVPRAKVGIVFSYPQDYAIDIQPQHPDMTYVDTLMTYYKALYRRNVAVDLIQDTADFSQYELVIAPLQYLMTPALADRYAAYVQAGGQLVLTMRTGVKEANNLCMTDAALPGKTLGQVLGLTVPEYDCLRDVAVVIDWAGQQYTGTHWADLIEPTTAEPLATYGSEFYAGTPAITKNRYGAGTAYYVGTELTDDLADRLVAGLPTVAAETIATPAEVEIVHRDAAAKRYYFVLNHTGEQQNITIPAGWQAYFSDQDSGHLAPYSYQVFTEEQTN